MDYEHMAADVGRFIEDQNLKDVTLIGHSMGGKISMALALLNTQIEFKQLLIVDMSPKIGPISKSSVRWINKMVEIEKSNLKTLKEVEDMLKKVERNTFRRGLLMDSLYINDEGYYKFRLPVQLFKDSIEDIGGFPFTLKDNKQYKKNIAFIKGENSP